MKFFLTLITITAMASTCQYKLQTSNITKIEFGTSFGSCIGYCEKTVSFTSEEISKVLKATRSKELPEKKCKKTWNDFSKLTSKVDLNSFQSLQETIGCPDCADGGAEWIEIFTSEGSKRVMYEYGKEPKEVKSFISDLRKQFDNLGECE